MSKRSNGEGTLRLRSDKRWEARYTTRDGGRWRQRSLFASTKEGAARRLREALASRDRGLPVTPARETLGTYLDAWLKGAQATLRPGTFAGYRQIVCEHLAPRLGYVALARLQPHDIARTYQELLESGRAPKTVRNIHGVLHRALEQALRWRLVPVNVADLVDPPRVTRREMQALDNDEVRRVLDAAHGDDLEALWVLALTAGLRQGELLALRWPDVALDDGTLRVVASLTRITGQGTRLVEPKTPRSRRQVALSGRAVDVLRQHRQRQRESALASGQAYDRQGHVFAREDGRPLAVVTTWKRWRRLLERAQVRPVRFHDARHTAATTLLSRGVHPKLVSEMLGHSTTALTLDVYSHVTPLMHREAARVMDELFPQ
jgi:integrase